MTLSEPQAKLAAERVAEAGLSSLVEVRRQDYRDVTDGPVEAISSIGMFEHVGLSQLQVYFERLFSLLAPGGRLLNHGISRPPSRRARFARAGFLDRYVFPDGEVHEVGTVVSAMQRAGFEVRHLESLREHYPLTYQADGFGGEKTMRARVIRELIDEIKALRRLLSELDSSAGGS